MATTPTNSGDQLTYEQIMALSKNMFDKMYIMENGAVRQLDPKVDTRTAYFEKSKIDALFAANPGCDGLKIYFGVHDKTIFDPAQPTYNNKLMVALVTTTKETDNLDISAKIGNLPMDGSGGGIDNAKLCPPDTNCKS